MDAVFSRAQTGQLESFGALTMKRLLLAALITPAILVSCRQSDAAKPAQTAAHEWRPPEYVSQQPRKSPHETIHLPVEGNRVTIVYGRPYMPDRTTGVPRSVWGGNLVPYDKIWRLGADEATLFITQRDIEVGGVTLPAGAYTLYLHLFADDSAQLLINTEIGQWGLEPPDPKKEFARVPLKRQPLAAPVDPFTIRIENGQPGGGLLRFQWDNAEYSVAFRNKAPAPQQTAAQP